MYHARKPDVSRTISDNVPHLNDTVVNLIVNYVESDDDNSDASRSLFVAFNTLHTSYVTAFKFCHMVPLLNLNICCWTMVRHDFVTKSRSKCFKCCLRSCVILLKKIQYSGTS